MPYGAGQLGQTRDVDHDQAVALEALDLFMAEGEL
jgi:hypothetical protein